MAPQVGVQAFAYKVGNTFVGMAANDATAPREKRRTRSVAQPADDSNDVRFGSFLEEDALPLAEFHTKGGEEPGYFIPTTPSPFMHSAMAPSMVPPFEGYGWGFPDMGLPPAFGIEACYSEDGGFAAQGMESQYMQDMQFIPEMYDPSYGQYPTVSYPWASAGMPGAEDGGNPEEVEGCNFMESNMEELAAKGEACPVVNTSDAPKDGNSRRRKGRREANDGNSEATADWANCSAMTQPMASDVCGAGRGGNAGNIKKWGYEASGGQVGAATNADSEETGGAAQPADYTTVMLRNIPNKYTREMLVKQLSVDFNGEFDFMYLPIDFKNKCNVGYCFINFRTCDICARFVAEFHGVDVRKCLPGLNSRKVAEVTPARVQGLVENVNRLRNSPVMNQLQEHPEWMPLIFDENGRLENFPSPEQPLQPVKQRGRGRARLLRETST